MKHSDELPDMISDHAVLRWLERVSGIDVRKQVAESMLAEGRAAAVRAMRNGKLRVPECDAVLVVENSRVITVLNASMTRHYNAKRAAEDPSEPYRGQRRHDQPRPRRVPRPEDFQ